MQKITINIPRKDTAIYKWAAVLALITIFYNISEGLISIFFGHEDESFALFGFGLDSFVEVSSGIGIWHMIRRIQRNEGETADHFERTALTITGGGFYILTAGLTAMAVINLYQGHKPETTFWGIVISLLSIITMWFLIHYKMKVGKALNSPAILADAACTRACLQLSFVLLASSVGYKFTGIGGFDSVGTLVIAGLCWREGNESFEKAKAGNFACACGGQCKSDAGAL